MKTASFRPATGMHNITASNLDGLLTHRTEREDLCFWPCPYGHNEVVFEGFVKCEGGVRHLVHRYDCATIHGTALDTLEHGTFSPAHINSRNRATAQSTPVFSRCSTTGARRQAIAQPSFTGGLTTASAPDWTETVVFADWQRVAYPAQWRRGEITGLLESLHAINYHSLAGIVAESASD